MSDRIPRAHPGNVFDISAPRGQAKWQNHICLRASQALVSARRSAFGVRRSQRNEAGCCPATLTPALSRKREKEQYPAPLPLAGEGAMPGPLSRLREREQNPAPSPASGRGLG